MEEGVKYSLLSADHSTRPVPTVLIRSKFSRLFWGRTCPGIVPLSLSGHSIVLAGCWEAEIELRASLGQFNPLLSAPLGRQLSFLLDRDIRRMRNMREPRVLTVAEWELWDNKTFTDRPTDQLSSDDLFFFSLNIFQFTLYGSVVLKTSSLSWWA